MHVVALAVVAPDAPSMNVPVCVQFTVAWAMPDVGMGLVGARGDRHRGRGAHAARRVVGDEEVIERDRIALAVGAALGIHLVAAVVRHAVATAGPGAARAVDDLRDAVLRSEHGTVDGGVAVDDGLGRIHRERAGHHVARHAHLRTDLQRRLGRDLARDHRLGGEQADDRGRDVALDRALRTQLERFRRHDVAVDFRARPRRDRRAGHAAVDDGVRRDVDAARRRDLAVDRQAGTGPEVGIAGLDIRRQRLRLAADAEGVRGDECPPADAEIASLDAADVEVSRAGQHGAAAHREAVVVAERDVGRDLHRIAAGDHHLVVPARQRQARARVDGTRQRAIADGAAVERVDGTGGRGDACRGQHQGKQNQTEAAQDHGWAIIS
ncbi:conserved hypothetical protein [Ricinus communis]|uniref:Uncharacterized protein n=1 Tax=Ricinus communis TaxID=3988 RepID=B9THA3_RICCO|nr:conserved hypothetical protein [Ricinus communis]